MSRRPVTATAWLEIDADEARYIRVIPRDPWAPMVTARWRPRWSWARTWRHRERVRFGAWEARPSRPGWLAANLATGAVPDDGPNPCACCQIPWAIPDEATRAAEASSGASVGVSEGPGDSGRSQTYKRVQGAIEPDANSEEGR